MGRYCLHGVRQPVFRRHRKPRVCTRAGLCVCSGAVYDPSNSINPTIPPTQQAIHCVCVVKNDQVFARLSHVSRRPPILRGMNRTRSGSRHKEAVKNSKPV